MRTTTVGLALETTDHPETRIHTDERDVFAMVFLDGDSGGAHLVAQDPAALRRLAASCDAAADRLENALATATIAGAA